MELHEKEKIDRIIALRKRANGFYGLKSKVFRAFTEMERQTYADGALPRRDKELIATGISVATGCESCMEWHIKQALDLGASEEQVLEAIEVGIEMSGGPGTVHARFAMLVLEYYRQ